MSTRTNAESQPASHDARRDAFEEMIATLTVLLRGQLERTRSVARLMRRRFEADAAGDILTRDYCLAVEKEALLGQVLADRERLACLTEIGLTLEHPTPSRLRLAELILHVGPEARDELLEIRDDCRDLADEMDSLTAWGARLERHPIGDATLFVEPGWKLPGTETAARTSAGDDGPGGDLPDANLDAEFPYADFQDDFSYLELEDADFQDSDVEFSEDDFPDGTFPDADFPGWNDHETRFPEAF